MTAPATIPQLNLVGFSSDKNSRVAKPYYRVGIHVYPHSNDPVFTNRKSKIRKLNWVKDETEGSVFSWNWSKQLGQTAGSWTASIKQGRESTLNVMDGDIIDGDWADVIVNRNGVEFPICRGVIDSARQSTGSSGGATTRTITLAGRDHGALFEHIIAWNNIYIQTFGELSFGLHAKRIEGEPGGDPSTMFERLIRSTFALGTDANRSAWQLPPALTTVTGSKHFIDELSIFNNSQTRGYWMNEQQLWAGSGQTLHQTISEWCNPLLNEWFYDIELQGDSISKDRLNIFAEIREKPFVNTTEKLDSPFFTDIDHVKIPSWLIESTDLGRAGYERFNIFEISANQHYLKGQETTAMTPVIYSKEQIRKYGLRPKSDETKYIAQGGDGNWEIERRLWQKLVTDWYAPNPYFLSGTIVIGCMIPEIKIGSRFTIDTGNPKTSPTFYVEGVEHTFQWAMNETMGPKTNTRLMVTRGFVGTDQEYLNAVTAISSAFVDEF